MSLVLAASRSISARSLDRTQQRDVMSLASVLLSHESFELADQRPSRVPRSWFLNLETLYEDALRRQMSAVIPDFLIERGAETGPRIFTGTAQFGADPDVVIRRRSGDVQAIGDAKYKDWPGRGTAAKLHADLYQLLAHASAFHAPAAFLAFAHDRFEGRHLGVSTTGCDTWMFAVDVRNINRDAMQICSELGLAEPIPAAA
jgi:5-methylcytosine-specific restriction endonuclease McrBC regulatory subunit McrC